MRGRFKVICAANAKGRTAVGNDWLAGRLAMGHGSHVSTLVQRIRRDKKEQYNLEKHDEPSRIQDWYRPRKNFADMLVVRNLKVDMQVADWFLSCR